MAAKPPAGPPPNILAGVTPPTGDAATPPDGNPDSNIPLPLTPDQLSKLGVTDMTPGQAVLATVRIMVGGDPANPMPSIAAIGEVRPDDGSSSDLVSLSNDAPQPGPEVGGVPSDEAPEPTPIPGSQPSGDDDDLYTSKRGSTDVAPPGTVAAGSPEEEALIGYRRPPTAAMKKMSAKDALGE